MKRHQPCCENPDSKTQYMPWQYVACIKLGLILIFIKAPTPTQAYVNGYMELFAANATISPDSCNMGIIGQVTDKNTGEPISGAVVYIYGTAGCGPFAHALTDVYGNYMLSVSEGTFKLNIAHKLYLGEDDTVCVQQCAQMEKSFQLTLE